MKKIITIIIIILISVISINAIAQDKIVEAENVKYYSYDDDIVIIEKTNKRGYVKKLIIVDKDDYQQKNKNVDNYEKPKKDKVKKKKEKRKLQLGKRAANLTVSILLGTSAIVMQDLYRMRVNN
jgi:hypothetical protein|tara:strand:- start:3990 stop:4361 length:372 start_codon:yes stop_codon:yes gene_type:complete